MSTSDTAESAKAVKKALADAEERVHITVRERNVGTGQMTVSSTADSVTARHRGKDYMLEKLHSPEYAHDAQNPVLVMRIPSAAPRYYQWAGNSWRQIKEEELGADPNEISGSSDPVMDWTHELIEAVK